MTTALATKPESISRNANQEERISALERDREDKKEFVAKLKEEIEAEQERIPEAEHHFRNVEQLFFMPKPRATEKQVADARATYEQTIREVEVGVKKRKGSIIETEEQMAEIEARLASERDSYKKQRTAELKSRWAHLLVRQKQTLLSLISIQHEAGQIIKEEASLGSVGRFSSFFIFRFSAVGDDLTLKLFLVEKGFCTREEVFPRK